ncbi:hypothetical protein P8452_42888 [Trifolium repens]|nr:hypothetical protein P8452_42888 [Trifolium repens]
MDYSKSYMFFGVVIFVTLCSQVLTAIHEHDESPITVSHHNGELQVMMNARWALIFRQMKSLGYISIHLTRITMVSSLQMRFFMGQL